MGCGAPHAPLPLVNTCCGPHLFCLPRSLLSQDLTGDSINTLLRVLSGLHRSRLVIHCAQAFQLALTSPSLIRAVGELHDHGQDAKNKQGLTCSIVERVFWWCVMSEAEWPLPKPHVSVQVGCTHLTTSPRGRSTRARSYALESHQCKSCKCRERKLRVRWSPTSDVGMPLRLQLLHMPQVRQFSSNQA
jgi:hypothetical protein